MTSNPLPCWRVQTACRAADLGGYGPPFPPFQRVSKRNCLWRLYHKQAGQSCRSKQNNTVLSAFNLSQFKHCLASRLRKKGGLYKSTIRQNLIGSKFSAMTVRVNTGSLTKMCRVSASVNQDLEQRSLRANLWHLWWRLINNCLMINFSTSNQSIISHSGCHWRQAGGRCTILLELLNICTNASNFRLRGY